MDLSLLLGRGKPPTTERWLRRICIFSTHALTGGRNAYFHPRPFNGHARFAGTADAQRTPGDPEPATHREVLARQIDRTSVGLQAESARFTGLASALEQLPPNAALRALSNAQRANPALTVLAPLAAATAPSAQAIGEAAARLRSASADLARDAVRLQAVGEGATARPLADTLSALNQLELSNPARNVIALASAGFPAIVGFEGGTGGMVSAAQGGATPFVVGHGLWTTDMPSVGGIVRSDVQGRLKVNCTATLVAAHAVLTARHCVDGTIDPNPPSGVFFQHAGFVPVATTNPILLHTGGTFPRGDLALVFLRRAITEITPIELNSSGRTPVGSAAVAVGFGFRSGTVMASAGAVAPLLRETGVKLRGTVETANCPAAAGQISLAGASLICWISKWNNFQGETGSTCEGDSGGPLFATLGGSVVLVGVTGGGILGCAAQTIAWETEVFDYLAWIRESLGSRPIPAALAWTNPLHPLSNPGRFIHPQSTDQMLLDEDGTLEAVPFDLEPGHGMLRIAINGSADPYQPSRRPLSRLELHGPAGTTCTQTTPSIFLVCEVSDPVAGSWSFRLVGRPGAQIQISAVTYRH